MRLLNVETCELTEFIDDPPAYAIASHRWTSEEVTLHEFTQQQSLHKSGHSKIKKFCSLVQSFEGPLKDFWRPIRWLWIDTVCIDKTNSVELQEALNSMFKWYRWAEICLVFLHDVPSLESEPFWVMRKFHESSWFTRGWTLQELIAPQMTAFYNSEWETLGYLEGGPRSAGMRRFRAKDIGFPLDEHLERRTGIRMDILRGVQALDTVSIEEKQSWMKDRTTTREEDTVYCQLGIFGVFMPLIYGEGEHAMVRLEEAIEQKKRREEVSELKKRREEAIKQKKRREQRAAVRKTKLNVRPELGT